MKVTRKATYTIELDEEDAVGLAQILKDHKGGYRILANALLQQLENSTLVRDTRG